MTRYVFHETQDAIPDVMPAGALRVGSWEECEADGHPLNKESWRIKVLWQAAGEQKEKAEGGKKGGKAYQKEDLLEVGVETRERRQAVGQNVAQGSGTRGHVG